MAWTRALVLVHVTTRALVSTLTVALYLTPSAWYVPPSHLPSSPSLLPTILQLIPKLTTMAIKFDESASAGTLPTPPHSPNSVFFAYPANQLVAQSHQSHIHRLHHPHPHPHHKHTATMLDSLTSFYQQEQYWVHHTRAALELAVTKGIDGVDPQPLTGSSLSNSHSPLSPAASEASCSAVRVKAEPGSENNALASPASSAYNSPTLASSELALSSHSTSLQHQQHTSRWLRRKNQMRLHLSGISTSNPDRRRRPAKAPPSEPAAHLLEMFAELVDARMESCARMERLVRESGRGCAVC